MKKLMGYSLAMLGLGLLMVGKAEAVGVRGAKPVQTINVTPLVVGISTGAAQTSASFPAAVYSVMVGTGAVTDFVAIFDTATAVGINAVLQTNGFVMRLYATSATQPTQYSFDPPLQFARGLVAANATALVGSFVTYEKGRPAGQGY